MTFISPRYLSILPALVAGLRLSGGLLWIRVRPPGAPVGAFGLLVGVLFGPMMFLDLVAVDEQRQAAAGVSSGRGALPGETIRRPGRPDRCCAS